MPDPHVDAHFAQLQAAGLTFAQTLAYLEKLIAFLKTFETAPIPPAPPAPGK